MSDRKVLPLEIINTPDLVEKKLNKLNVSKSAGPNGFHPWVLKELSSTIKVPLHIIFSKSTMKGTLLEAIHKKG